MTLEALVVTLASCFGGVFLDYPAHVPHLPRGCPIGSPLGLADSPAVVLQGAA